MWQELPSRSFGLAMNVIDLPPGRRSPWRRLVDGVVVARCEHLVVPEGDLVLAEVALALGRLDVQPGAAMLVADPAQQRLDPAGAEQRVVDVVQVRRRQVAVAPLPGLLVLSSETTNSSSVPACAVNPRSAAGRAGGAGSAGARPRRRPSSSTRSASSSAVPGCQGTRRSVARSGRRTKSPYPRSQTTSRIRRRCSCRRPRPAGSCRPPRRAPPPRRGSTARAAACPATAPACRRGQHDGVDLALGDGDPQLFQRERSFPHSRASITKVYWQTGSPSMPPAARAANPTDGRRDSSTARPAGCRSDRAVGPRRVGCHRGVPRRYEPGR